MKERRGEYMKTEIVVVDDEKDIADLIELYLQNENYEIHKFYEAVKAWDYIQHHSVDMAILDVMMPVMDGMELCTKIRKEYTFPIIMLTAKDSEVDKIMGLTIGADDYITKPFTPLEVVARIKAQLRRYHQYSDSGNMQNIINIDGLSLDLGRHICMINEREINLTPKEFAILQCLCENKGMVIPTETLFERVWKEEYLHNSNNTVMVHIRHLREKMKDTQDPPKYIKTVWGVGYKIGK